MKCCKFIKEVFMPIGKTLEKRIQYRIKRKKDSVFMLSDFVDLSDKNQVMRALKKLMNKNLLVKVGQGLYSRARISSITKNPIPEKDITIIAKEALKKLNIKVGTSKYEEMYKLWKSTQVPTGRVIAIEGKGRVSRKIGFNGSYIKYARAN